MSKLRPILFSAPMVRAILEGRKTQTRRIMKPQPLLIDPDATRLAVCPYGVAGDRLWVREAFSPQGKHGASSIDDAQFAVMRDGTQKYRDGALVRGLNSYAPGAFDAVKFRPSIHMPHWASRITLEVEAVRIERLQNMSERDAVAEGCFVDEHKYGPCDDSATDVFMDLWDGINGERAPWARNPMVWVVQFSVMSEGSKP